MASIDLHGNPGTRFTDWRLRSRLCVGIDVLAIAAGSAFALLVALDDVVSWPSNYILFNQNDLVVAYASSAMPFLVWGFVSFVMVYGFASRASMAPGPVDRFRAALRRRPLIGPVGKCFAVALAACLAVIVTGFALGAVKADGRVLPGPVYEISATGLGSGTWTPVSAATYQWWEARMIHLDGMFTLVGLFAVMLGVSMIRLHRTALREGRNG